MIPLALLMIRLAAPFGYADLPTETSPVLNLCWRGNP